MDNIESLAEKLFVLTVTHQLEQMEEMENEDIEGITRVSFEWAEIFQKELDTRRDKHFQSMGFPPFPATGGVKC